MLTNFRVPHIDLPLELVEIHRFIGTFDTLIEGPVSLTLINHLERYPFVPDVMEFVFEVAPTVAADTVRQHCLLHVSLS